MLSRRCEYDRTTGLILRRTFPALYKSHLIKLEQEFPELMRFYNASNKVLEFPNGSLLFFGSAEHSKDMSAFYSAEFDDVLVDEAQEFSQAELERLSGSNRGTGNTNIKPTMLYTFMPGMSEEGLPPIGLAYLKRLFIDRDLRPEELKDKWHFIQAFSWDNYEWARPELTALGISFNEFYEWSEQQRREFFLEHTAYGRKLQALTDHGLRDAWLFGKWDTFQGMYFPQFERGKHVISNAELLKRLKPWHKRWGSGDWGYDHPHAIYEHAQDETGRVVTFGEIWGREVNEKVLGKTIGEHYAGDKLQAFPFSWDAGKLSKRSGPGFPQSIMQMISEAMPAEMVKPHPADSAAGSRIAGARLMSQLLDSGMWQICEDCPKLIDCLPTLLRDPDNPEDVLKVDYSENYIGDDPYDGARMGLQFMLGAAEAPKVFDPAAIMKQAQAVTSIDFKAQKVLGKFDKTFGRDPSENEWFPKA